MSQAESYNRKHSVSIRGHSTSITLEDAFWESLKEIAELHKKSLNQLIAEIDSQDPKNLSSALRLFVLQHYKNTGQHNGSS